ncbi:MFS transporter (macronuclear) [Tetrahymena thermophila SB210]|uniref:MFS transporter n=1 Tax=Tetrahymena thermophila (strain SB210) TaxID=312017 RepID=X1W3N7_TETTS|nr:MFS transporter [Tetrahymena thermophila SB210]EAS04253.3 MFS transporter [Tetrahymena thermophila SB210]|eukprot:XP_001024498.3 MFS transporter [Tetrahymena thermophila SB210]
MLFKLHIFLIVLAIQISKLISRELIFNPQPISSIRVSDIDNFTSFYQDITEDNKWAFLTRIEGGFCVISLEDIQQPTLVSIVKAKGAYEVKVKKNYLFLSDLEEGLVIFDITDPPNPKKIYTLTTPMTAQSITVTDDMKTLFLIASGIVYCYDISNVYNPIFLSKAGVYAPNSNKVKLDRNQQLLALANHISGLQIIDIRDRNNIKLRATQFTGSSAWDSYFTHDISTIYVADAYFGLLAASISGILDIPKEKDDLFSLNFKSVFQSPQLTMSIVMTQMGDYLVLGFRSIGLKLFQIINQDYYSLYYIQDIDGSYLCNKLILSSDEKYAFASNGHSLVIYQSDQPQINKDFPNLFNTFQSSLISKFQDPWAWEIFCFNDNKHVAVAGGSSSFIFSIENAYNPVLLSTIPSIQGAAYDGLTLINNNEPQNLLYLGLSELGFYIYDISNLSAPNKKNHIIPSNVMNDSDGVQLNHDNSLLMISNGSIGVSVYDVKTDKWNPILIAEFVNKGQYMCTFEKCAITQLNDYLFCACREEGVVIFNFQNKTLLPMSIIKRVGSEYPILSADEIHLFVAVGFQGLIIANVQDKLNPKIVSTLPVDGWAQTIHFIPIFGEKYIIASQLEKGQLTIIDVEDYANPYIFSILNFQNESSSSFCITPDNKSIFIIGNAGMRFMPLQNDIKIHTQISKLSTSSSGKVYYEILDKGQKLQVGQTVQMVFVPLELRRKIKFTQVYYYRNYEKNSLPYWMTFLSNQQMIQMTVDKQGAFNTFSNEKKGENIIILEVMKEIFDYDFVNDLINQNMASAIYFALQNQGIISTYNYLDSNFDPNKFTYLDFYTSKIPLNASTDNQIQAYIKQVLAFSKIDYPIRFYIESSLEFNYKSYLQDQKPLLQTPSYQIIAYFNIKSQGKFIRKTFEGVLSSFSDDLTSVKIEGPSTKVNEIVSNSLQIANFTNKFQDILITGRISDSSNYDLEFSETYDVFQSFIKLNNPVTLNQNLQLQQQFNKFYDKSDVSVEAKFQFTFDQNTFQDADGQQLTFKAYIVTDSSLEPVEIAQGSSQWIEFNPQSLTFSGMKTISSFLTAERIKITASDGFTEVSDQFTIYFNQLPFMFTVQLLFQIFGPLIGIFSIWRYRSSIYLILMESSYMYSNETAIAGELYRKQIVIFDNVQDNANKLWTLYKKENQKFLNEIKQMYLKEKSINISEIMKKMFQTFEKNQKKFSSLDPREFDFDESRLLRVIKGKLIRILLNDDKETKQVLKYLRKQGTKYFSKNDWYKRYVSIQPTFQASKQRMLNKNQSKLSSSQIDNHTDKINNQIQNDDIERNNLINEQEVNLETYHNVYKLRNNDKSDEIQEYKNLNPFPVFQVQEHAICQDADTIQKTQFDIYLLKEYLIIEASGIDQRTFSLNPSKGESLILQSHQISNISAFKKDSGCCMGFRRLLKDDYRPIGLSINNPLPKWLNCEIIDGVIHIWGIPKAKDEPEILIRIVNELQFTVFSFLIIIKDKEGGELRDKIYVKSKDQQNKKLKNQIDTDSYIKTKNNLVQGNKQMKDEKYKTKIYQETNSETNSHQNIFQNTLKSNQNLYIKQIPIQDIQQIFSVYSASRREIKEEKNDSNEQIRQIINQKDISVKELNHSRETIPDENQSRLQIGTQHTQNWQQQNQQILESKENLHQYKTYINQVQSTEDKIQIMSQKKDLSRKNKNQALDQNC